jgi:hypothetical protein
MGLKSGPGAYAPISANAALCGNSGTDLAYGIGHAPECCSGSGQRHETRTNQARGRAKVDYAASRYT